MLVLLLTCGFATAGGTYVAVADPSDWTDPAVRARLDRMIGPGATFVPAADLVQPGRERVDEAPGSQPGRVSDPELKEIRAELERAADAGDCEAQLALAERVTFVDRASVRQVRFEALTAAGSCARAAHLEGPGWTANVGGTSTSLPLASAAVLALRDPSLDARTGGALRVALDEALIAIRQAPSQTIEAPGGSWEVWLDGVAVEPEADRIELPWGRADLQLVRNSGGAPEWGPSFRLEPSEVPHRPLALADETAVQLVAQLPTDGAQAFAASVGAFMALVGADELQLAVPDRRKHVLWRWMPAEGRFVPAKDADVL